MLFSECIVASRSGLRELDVIVASLESEMLISSPGVRIISDNINFFTKAFLVTLCAHLETGIKDVVFHMSQGIESRLTSALVPASIIDWRYAKKAKQERFESLRIFEIALSKKEIDELVSGNVYKTREAMLLVGVDLACREADWERWKEVIQSIVTKRNSIVHHNDDASDLTLGDIRSHIKNVDGYFDFLGQACDLSRFA